MKPKFETHTNVKINYFQNLWKKYEARLVRNK